MIEDQRHDPTDSSALAAASRCPAYLALNSGAEARRVLPDPGGVAGADAREKGTHFIEARLVAERGVDDRRETARACRAHQRARGDQMVK